jgi:hypothetical protein
MSHFSTIKTELRDRQALLAAIGDLGHTASEGERPVRGYRGQVVTADLAIAQDNGADIGFRWSETSGCYELVTDLDLWQQPQPLERFLARLTQRYALRTILTATAREGFEVSEQSDRLDGAIELVVTRWSD